MSKKYITDVIKIDGQLLDGNGSAGTSGQILSSTGTATDWISLSEISGVDGTGTANYVAKWSDTDTITDSIIYDNGTNVGIGTTSPASGYKLDVNGLGTFNTAISIQGVDTGNPTAANEEIRLSGYGIMGSRGSFYITNANTSGAMFFGIGGAHNNNTKMTINSSGNVGIGTTSPAYKLDVAGEIRTSSRLWISTVDAISLSGNDLRVGYSNSNLLFRANSAERMRIDSSGNVGINTTSPGSGYAYDIKLDIVAPQLGGIPLRLVRDSSATNYGAMLALAAKNSNSEIITYGAIIGGIVDSTDGSEDGFVSIRTIKAGVEGERVRVDEDGNVGIGTTSPAAKLSVGSGGHEAAIFSVVGESGVNTVANFRDEDGENVFKTEGSVAGADLSISFGDIDGAGGSNYFTATDSKTYFMGGNVGIGTTSPKTELEVKGDITVQNKNGANPTDAGSLYFTESGNTWGADMYGFRINQQGVSNYLNFQSANITTVKDILTLTRDTGNVGIGTTSPPGKLTVVGSGGRTNIESTGYILDLNRDNGMSSVYNSDNFGTLSLGAGGVENYLYINWNGNVGINTTSPGATLEVVGRNSNTEAAFKVTDQGDRFFEVVPDFSTTFRLGDIDGLGDEPVIIGGYSDLKFNVGGSTTMTLENNNRVGIGTTSPAYKLDVNGTGRFSSTLTAGTNMYLGGLIYHSGDIDTFFGFPSNDTFKIRTNNSDRMYIDSSGNVGIGTTSPASQLGSIKVLDISSTGNGEIILDHTDAGVSSDIGLYSWNRNNDHLAHIKASCDGATDSAFISFHTQATGGSFANAASNERMRITSTGNVGIGTSAPAYQLQLSLNSAAKPSSSLWTVVSDSRVKENIRDYTTGLEAILKIEPKLYDYNGKAGFEKTKDNIGIIAQDMQDIMPETIKTYNTKLNEDDTEDTELLNFDGHAVTFALINAVKDLKAEIEELKNRIQTLENK